MQTVDGPVLVSVPCEHVAVVKLNRPEARNAIDAEVATALGEIVERIEADPSIWVAVLAATGDRVFCAGADLKTVARTGLATLYTETGGFAGFTSAPRTKPWIAAVEGLALAGGFELVLACDLIVAGADAAFGLPEVTRGLVASAGGLYRLPRALPAAVALELIVTGNRLAAPRAADFGLVNRVVPAGRASEGAVELAREICRCAPLAVRESLAVARRAHETDAGTLQRASEAAQLRLSRTKDYAEGPRAFFEKRAPRWLGS
jgi:enoyl-CoA hydratase/carnithine racemase